MLIMLISMYINYSHVNIPVLQYGRLPETIKEQQQRSAECDLAAPQPDRAEGRHSVLDGDVNTYTVRGHSGTGTEDEESQPRRDGCGASCHRALGRHR